MRNFISKALNYIFLSKWQNNANMLTILLCLLLPINLIIWGLQKLLPNGLQQTPVVYQKVLPPQDVKKNKNLVLIASLYVQMYSQTYGLDQGFNFSTYNALEILNVKRHSSDKSSEIFQQYVLITLRTECKLIPISPKTPPQGYTLQDIKENQFK